MTDSAPVIVAAKTPTESVNYRFIFDRLLEQRWRAGEILPSGVYRRPSVPNGFEYEVTTAGQSGSVEPVWPRTAGNTVVSGSATFTARAAGTNATDSIATAELIADTDVTATIVTTVNNVVTARVAGGVAGRRYKVTCRIVTNGGQTFDQSIFVPVQQQSAA